MSPGKLVDEKDVGCQDKSGPSKIHEVILVRLWAAAPTPHFTDTPQGSD